MDMNNISSTVNSSTVDTNETLIDPMMCYSSISDTVDMDCYLEKTMGPQHLPLNVVIPITVVYMIIFISGVVGNVAVFVVIIRNSRMHTATNYYLFSLGVSDIIILLLGLPNDLKFYWQQYPWVLGEAFCKIRALVTEMTSYSSVLTIVALSMERYLAICHPLHAYIMSGLRRALKVIGFVWAISFVSALPFAVYTTVNYLDYPPGSGKIIPGSAFCALLDKHRPTDWPLYEISSFVFFILPMGIIVFLYIRMGSRIRRRSNYFGKVAGSVHGETKQRSSKRAIIRMLAAVVVAFFVCWAPFHAQRLLYVYGQKLRHYREINEKMYYITGCFYYFSSTINPILYNVISAKYRAAFRETLCGGQSTSGIDGTHNNNRDSTGYRSAYYYSHLSRKGRSSSADVTEFRNNTLTSVDLQNYRRDSNAVDNGDMYDGSKYNARLADMKNGSVRSLRDQIPVRAYRTQQSSSSVSSMETGDRRYQTPHTKSTGSDDFYSDFTDEVLLNLLDEKANKAGKLKEDKENDIRNLQSKYDPEQFKEDLVNQITRETAV